MRTITWRVVQWVRTEDHRWRVDSFSDHPDSDVGAALAVARDWIKYSCDEIERGRHRVLVHRAPTLVRTSQPSPANSSGT